MKLTLYALISFAFLIIVPATHAREFRLGIHDEDINYYAYQISATRLALATTGHSLKVVPVRIPYLRAFRGLRAGTADFDLVIAGYTPEREKNMGQIYVPLTRGLLGVRLFAIKKDTQVQFDNIHTIKKLTQSIVIGSGKYWADTAIMGRAGFQIITGDTKALWHILEKGRIQGFPRSAIEINTEIKNQEKRTGSGDLVVENKLMLVYPLDYFLYTRKENQKLRELLEAGFAEAYRNGSLMKHFRSSKHALNIQDIGALSQRKMFKLDNPTFSERMKSIPAHYWHQFATID